jgi:hypothetical protein
MPADHSYIIKHVVADLERIRALLQQQAEKSRTWQDDEGMVEINEKYVDDVVKRLDQNIRALCNAAERDQHSTSVRSHALIMEKGMNTAENIV